VHSLLSFEVVNSWELLTPKWR